MVVFPDDFEFLTIFRYRGTALGASLRTVTTLLLSGSMMSSLISYRQNPLTHNIFVLFKCIVITYRWVVEAYYHVAAAIGVSRVLLQLTPI